MPQVHKERSEREEESLEEMPKAPTEQKVGEAAVEGAQQEAAPSDLDELLDRIDGLLETNAHEFVNGFLQEGGQ